MKLIKPLRTVSLLTLALGLAINGYSQAFLTNGLIAYYPFDGNASDQTTNANNGTPYGAVLTRDRFNRTNSAYSFNGTSDFISAPNQPYLTFPNGGDFSISVWAALSSPVKTVMYLVGVDNGAGDNPKWILAYGQLALPASPGYSGNYVHFITTGGSGSGVGYFLASVPYTTALGTWHQYLVSKAGTNYTTYIDGVMATGATNYENDNGVLKAGISGPSSIAPGITAPLTIGKAESGGFVNGELDDIRLYNRALSTSEVQQLYAIESAPALTVHKAVYLDSPNLWVGTNYQVQISTDLNTWTNYGAAFTATNSMWRSLNYWDVPNWDQLFFRLQTAP